MARGKSRVDREYTYRRELSASELGAALCRVFLEGAQNRPAHAQPK